MVASHFESFVFWPEKKLSFFTVWWFKQRRFHIISFGEKTLRKRSPSQNCQVFMFTHVHFAQGFKVDCSFILGFFGSASVKTCRLFQYQDHEQHEVGAVLAIVPSAFFLLILETISKRYIFSRSRQLFTKGTRRGWTSQVTSLPPLPNSRWRRATDDPFTGPCPDQPRIHASEHAQWVILSAKVSTRLLPPQSLVFHRVDGRNPAPVDMVNIPLFTRFFYIPGGWPDFWTINSSTRIPS